MSFTLPPLEPSRDKKTLRRQLQAERQTLVDRHQRAMHLQEVLRVWLMARDDVAVGAYWPIKGEFDALPALYRWAEADDRRCIGLPVTDNIGDGRVWTVSLNGGMKLSDALRVDGGFAWNDGRITRPAGTFRTRAGTGTARRPAPAGR